MPAVIGVNWCGTKLVVFQNQPILNIVNASNKERKPYSYQLREEVLNKRVLFGYDRSHGSPKNIFSKVIFRTFYKFQLKKIFKNFKLLKLRVH